MRSSIATLLALCGGLAVLYFFVAAVGAIDLENAIAATIGALLLAAVWFGGFVYRLRTNAGRAQRPDRERRGF